MPRPFRTCCFSFLSLRFSLRVLPDFFDAIFRGDLSAMPTPSLGGMLLHDRIRRSPRVPEEKRPRSVMTGGSAKWEFRTVIEVLASFNSTGWLRRRLPLLPATPGTGEEVAPSTPPAYAAFTKPSEPLRMGTIRGVVLSSTLGRAVELRKIDKGQALSGQVTTAQQDGGIASGVVLSAPGRVSDVPVVASYSGS
jgi:hypothetical protein